jgi:hypothetical protein
VIARRRSSVEHREGRPDLHSWPCLREEGAIVLTGSGRDNANATGDLDIGKDLTIQGAGARRTIIDQTAGDRVLDVLASATVALADVMIRGGHVAITADVEPPGPGGAGIRNGGTLTLNRVIVRGNGTFIAPGGGSANYGTMSVVESAIENNAADFLATGGGILNAGILTLLRSTVSDSRASGFQGAPTTGGFATPERSPWSIRRSAGTPARRASSTAAS